MAMRASFSLVSQTLLQNCFLAGFRAEVKKLCKQKTIPTVAMCEKGMRRMFLYLYLAVSALLLLMSFTHPRAQQSSNLSWAGLSFPRDWYEFLFLVCTVLFIPMMGVAFYCFLKGISLSLKQRSLRVGASALLVSIVASIALYSFNKWVFSELF
ncbi:hypothetical protein [Pseudomonas chlororaphis]|uniref:hypothetical protein n=1 Tax=Pseudomonas chlororaphis TaxID=587753 RepID=UPI000F777208|nr:hypothetical protein [Pseudomonas chlororaphis]MBM0284597.1 hypothetical protein [Pseudomonas chlororaphis]MDO1507854.1 hypothetical protein [Pseudomonas chlororaphis]TWR88965.1 hypothetical protein FJD36_29935 [Pseudomonas chlororaphis subsp. chlororaphis]WDG97706.1 hypothetical protein PUP54_28855 [Pseudomonas chlororaphis]WDH16576.1 hypothetical protein PUP70_00315 [Pseudomonas chlororaphis]